MQNLEQNASGDLSSKQDLHCIDFDEEPDEEEPDADPNERPGKPDADPDERPGKPDADPDERPGKPDTKPPDVFCLLVPWYIVSCPVALSLTGCVWATNHSDAKSLLCFSNG